MFKEQITDKSSLEDLYKNMNKIHITDNLICDQVI